MAGATISLVTKSGSNAFHGSAYYSGRNDKLNSFDTELKAGCPTCPKNKFRGNDYGYTIGGPVKKDKVFFFWSQEWNKRIEGLTATNHVPTMAERGGDFSDLAGYPASAGTGYPAGGLHDPTAATGTFGFAGAANTNTIPSARLSPAGEFKTASGAGTSSLANAVSIQNTTLDPGTFGYATQSRENGWRQIQYGLKFSF